MKAITILAAMLAITATSTTTATAAPICLQVRLINHTKVVDSKTIDFEITDNAVYRNALRTPCIGLNINGFEYVIRGEEVCENSQLIRVLRTHQVCKLGSFAILPPAQPESNH